MPSRIVHIILNAAHRPIEAIQLVVAIVAFAIGVYVISPAFVGAASPSLVLAFPQIIFGKIAFGVLVLAPSVPTILGLFFKKFQTNEWYSRSAFFMFVGFLFLVFLRLITVGPFPIVWIPTLAIALIMAICWAYWKAHA